MCDVYDVCVRVVYVRLCMLCCVYFMLCFVCVRGGVVGVCACVFVIVYVVCVCIVSVRMSGCVL